VNLGIRPLLAFGASPTVGVMALGVARQDFRRFDDTTRGDHSDVTESRGWAGLERRARGALPAA